MKSILTELRPRYVENEPDFRPKHTKFERLLSKSPTTMEVMAYDLVVHTGPEGTAGQMVGRQLRKQNGEQIERRGRRSHAQRSFHGTLTKALHKLLNAPAAKGGHCGGRAAVCCVSLAHIHCLEVMQIRFHTT